MKNSLIPLVIFLGMFSVPLFAQPTSPEEFIAEYRSAVQEKNSEKLFALTYFKDMSESDKERVRQSQQQLFFSGQDIKDILLVPLPGNFKAVQIMRGRKMEVTYPPVGIIRTEYSDTKNGVTASNAPYAIIDGRYFIVTSKITDLGWNGPPDKNIAFMVVGPGQDKVQIKAKWNASGVDLEETSNTPSCSMWGQYFNQITVTSSEDDTSVTLTIQEDGKAIYTSEILKGKGVLEYKRKNQ